MKKKLQSKLSEKKTTVLAVLIMICLISTGNESKAQFVVGNSHKFTIGDSFRTLTVDTTGVSEGNSGTNVVWNFSGINVNNDNFEVDFINPSTAPGNSFFPDATIVEKIDNSYIFIKQTLGEVYNLGMYNDNISTVYNNIQKSFEYPFAYGTSFTDNYSMVLQNEDYEVRSSGTVTMTGDAWGTIILPTGSYSSLRIKSVTNNTDSILIDGEIFVSHSTNTSYSWYIDGTKAPALSISYLQSDLFNLKSVSCTELGPTGIEEQNGLADGYTLDQNYPNPFNPSTKIQFSITKSGMVSIKVFDVTGKEVAVLANEYYGAGKHSVNFDGSALTSGTYFYRLEANGITQTKRMMLIK